MKFLLPFLFSLPLLGADIALLTPEEEAAGWQMLFNGNDLNNWRAYGSDARPGEGWKVDDGTLKKLKGIPAGDIITKQKYKDYTLVWEWRISESGNNGIKYLVTEDRKISPGPEFQLLDDIGHPDAKNGPTHQSGALYDIFPPSADKILKPAGEWNSSKLIIQGEKVQHWLNGALVVEYELGSPALLTAISKSKFKNAEGYGTKIEGHLMLTDHIDECWFRNMKILPGLHE